MVTSTSASFGKRFSVVSEPIRAIRSTPLRARNERGRPVDAVARFHLGNGARLERINWLADTSDKAIAQAQLYDLDHIEKNHEAYAESRAVFASSGVQRLLRPPLQLVPVAG